MTRPPPRVPAARAAGGAAAVRLLSLAKALGAPRPSGTRLSPAPSPRRPRGRSAPTRGRRRRSRRGDRRGCQLNRLLRKWKRSQKRRRERINLQTKKVQTKGKRGAKGKQAEVANQETKDLHAENGETKNGESPASDEAGEREAKSDQ